MPVSKKIQYEKVYLHLGAHRSASTTIQRNIKSNKNKLIDEAELIFVSGVDWVSSPFLKHFRMLFRGALQGCQYGESLEQAKDFITGLVDSTPSDEVLIS